MFSVSGRGKPGFAVRRLQKCSASPSSASLMRLSSSRNTARITPPKPATPTSTPCSRNARNSLEATLTLGFIGDPVADVLHGVQQRTVEGPIYDPAQVVHVTAQGIAVRRLVLPDQPLQLASRNDLG